MDDHLRSVSSSIWVASTDIERNFAGKGFDIVAGDNGSMSLSLSSDSIESKLMKDRASSRAPPVSLIGPADDVVPGHVYVVDEVIRPIGRIRAEDQAHRSLGDPHASKPAVLELTQSEYQRSFVSHNLFAH